MPSIRKAIRYPFRIPLKLRNTDSRISVTRDELSGNISSRGIYLDSSFPYEIGERVEIILEMPEAVAGRPVREWTCHGRIVHTRAAAGSRSGAGVEFFYYEIARASSKRRSIENLRARPQGRLVQLFHERFPIRIHQFRASLKVPEHA